MSKHDKPKPRGAPLGPDDPGFYGNTGIEIPWVTPTRDSMGRPLGDTPKGGDDG